MEGHSVALPVQEQVETRILFMTSTAFKVWENFSRVPLGLPMILMHQVHQTGIQVQGLCPLAIALRHSSVSLTAIITQFLICSSIFQQRMMLDFLGIHQDLPLKMWDFLTANITGQNNVGALVGYNRNSSNIDNSYATGTVIGGGNYVGGLVGFNNSSSIDNSYATGNVSGNDSKSAALLVLMVIQAASTTAMPPAM